MASLPINPSTPPDAGGPPQGGAPGPGGAAPSPQQGGTAQKLARLAGDLHSGASQAQLTLTACLVGLAAGQLLVGPISDDNLQATLIPQLEKALAAP